MTHGDSGRTENINFKGKAVTLKTTEGAVIDGGATDSVVKFVTNEGQSSVLDGFTIQNGFSGASSSYLGGGISIANASPTILNNHITGNVGCAGAGIGVYFGSPLIQGNFVVGNTQGGCTGGTGGGGILIQGASQPQIIGNTITGNSTGSDGGGIALFAAGNPVIRSNIIKANSSGGQGGGISMANDSDALVIQNLIVGNSASLGGGISALVPSGSTGPTVVNNTFDGNSGAQGGSEFYLSGFYNQTSVMNNIFVGTANQVAVYCDLSYSPQPPVFQYNDAFNPQGTDFAGACLGETGQNGNISADPRFVNASDFTLQSTSPAIDVGSNTAPDLPEQDLAGNDRILDGNGDCTATVDMGSYEFFRSSALTLSPVSLLFPDQLVGSSSAALSAAVTNNATTPSTVCGLSITGDFSQTNTCGSTIAPKGSCAINVSFTPTVHGPRPGFLQLITNDAGSPQSLMLAGKGVLPAVSLSTPSLTFSAQQVGTTSMVQTVMLNNTGDGPLTLSNVASTGDFSQTNSCGSSVAPATSCSFSVSFTPSASGDRPGSLTIIDNASGSPHSVTLDGSATDFSLAVATGGSASATVTAGGTVAYNLQVAPINGFTGTVALTCSGAPNLATCTVSPASVTPSGSGSPFTVTVTTTAASWLPTVKYFPRVPLPLLYALALLLTLLLFSLAAGLPSPPGRRALLASAAVLFFTMFWVAGCGGGGNGVPSHPGTPTGSYKLVLNGTSNGQSHALPLSLAVN